MSLYFNIIKFNNYKSRSNVAILNTAISISPSIALCTIGVEMLRITSEESSNLDMM